MQRIAKGYAPAVTAVAAPMPALLVAVSITAPEAGLVMVAPVVAPKVMAPPRGVVRTVVAMPVAGSVPTAIMVARAVVLMMAAVPVFRRLVVGAGGRR